MSGDTYVKEFLKISDFFISSKKVKIHKGYILVPRKIMDQFLLRNNYDTVENKLRIWKQLHWIDTDDGRNTKKVSLDGERVRVVKIDIKVFQTLAALFDEML